MQVFPKGGERGCTPQGVETGETHAPHQLEHARTLRSDVGLPQRVVNILTAVTEGTVSIGVFAIGERLDGLGGAIDAGEQIEVAAFAPGVACQRIGRMQLKPGFQGRVRRREQTVENPTHREHRRTRIDTDTTDR